MSEAEVRFPFPVTEGVRGGGLEGPAAQAAWFPKATSLPDGTPYPNLYLSPQGGEEAPARSDGGSAVVEAVLRRQDGRAASPILPVKLASLVHETWKYFLVSLAALALDYGLLVGLTAIGHLHYLVSAAIGFCTGLALNYELSTAFVFRERRLADRRMEFAGFLLIGLGGLVLNEALMKLFVEQAGIGYALAKVPATGVGFGFNFGVRRLLLFTKAAPRLRAAAPEAAARLTSAADIDLAT
jgi:putative flippase GtrA